MQHEQYNEKEPYFTEKETAEYRPENACKCAYIRKAFYENKISFDEALAEAKEDEKGGKI